MKQITSKEEFCQKSLIYGKSFRVFYFFLVLLMAIPCWSNLYAATSEYPSRPITLVVPLAPGGMTDASARLFADFLGKIVKQSVVVLNKPGGE